ncbi:MAG: aminotransferase class V-fold PLP-dependent enzyme [Saprospiraceae bacterium]|nr:aminotransferase class V-fold PLP-dependent enzyme [Saprospiraceae bacterium]
MDNLSKKADSAIIHLNNAGASLPPASVLKAMTDYLTLETEIGGYEAADLKTAEIRRFYTSTARLLNAKPENIAFCGSATDAFSRALSSIVWKPGDVVLTTENDYASNQIAFLALQKRYGISLVRAKDIPAGGVDVEDMARLIQQHHPRLVAVTHVPTNSGLIQPVEAIGRLCRAEGCLYLVDACQSAGQMPLDVQEIGCDFLSATLRKYLRGPRGAGFLYASDRVLKDGYELAIPDMRAATWTSADEYVTQPGAQRFEYWEMPIALVLGSTAAIDHALERGLPQIHQRINHLSDLCRNLLQEIPGVAVLDKGEHLCGIVTAHAAHWEPASLMAALKAQRINCRISPLVAAQIDFRKKGVEWALRISPHEYNTEVEILKAVEVFGSYEL